MVAKLSRLRALIENLPLRPTIAAALFVGLILPQGLAVWRDLSERRASLLSHLVSDHQRLGEALAIGMATPIWEVRPDTGRPLVEAMMRDDRVVEIAVSAPVLPRFLEATSPERRHGDIITLEHPVQRGDEEIGIVRLSMSTGPLDAEVARQARQVLLTGLIQLAFGLLLIFPLLRLKVLDPLRRLVSSSQALAAGDLDPGQDWTRRDELGVVGRSFEEMRLSLRRLIGDLETTNDDLRQREADLSGQTGLLQATLDNMTDGITLVDAQLRLKAWNDRFQEILEFPADLVHQEMSITDLHAYDVARRKYPDEVARGFVERMREGFRPGQSWSTQIETTDGRVISIRRRPMADGGFVTTYSDATEQVRAQRHADEALHLLEAVMDAVPAILHVKDRALRYQMVNRHFLDLWGFRRADVIGRTAQEVFDSAFLAEFVDRGPEVLATGHRLPFYEWSALLPDRDHIELLGTKVPLIDTHGHVTHVVTVEIDITQRKRAEQALRESEELHRLLVDLSPFGIMLHDRARIRFLNPAGCRMLGVDRPEPVLGMHYIDFVADDAKAVALAHVTRLFESGEPLPPAERRLVTIDGAPVEVSLAAVPVHRSDETLALFVFQDIGDRKTAERALKDSEKFYRQLIDVAPYGILLHSTEGIVFLNPAGRQILGVRSDADIDSRHYGDFVHLAERDAALTRLARVYQGETVKPAERRLVTSDGREIDVSVAGVPLRQSDGTLAVIMFADITEKKRSEQERQRWLQLFQDAIASIPNGFAVFDPQRRLVTCNDAFAQLYAARADLLAGTTAAELLQRFSDLVASVDGRAASDFTGDLGSTLDQLWWSESGPVQVEMRDGRWVLVAHHRTVEGGLVIVRTDVTDLKRMQQALRASEELYRLLVDLAPYGILLHDREAIVFMNNAGCRMLGTDDPSCVVGRHYCTFVPEAERPAAGERIVRVLARGEMLEETERRLNTLDGREITVASSAVPFTRGGDRLAYVFFIDITARKQAEAEIQRQRDALHQAEKMSALGSLLAGVAHELNNPLSVVVGRAIMLEDQPLDPGIATSVGKIRAAAERCARIVRTFLAIARQQAPARLPVSIAPLIEAALDLLSYSLNSAGVEVICDLHPSLPPILADADQLSQVFNNLVINARQAMTESPPPRVLHIHARHDPAAAQIRITFMDNGPGISPSIRPRVFDPFFTTKPPGVGTGIGLAVCRGIVEAHGGTIVLEAPEPTADNPRPGAAFTVVLPAGATLPGPGTAAEDPVKRLTVAASEKCARRVLVVDDEVEIVGMLYDILVSEGCEVRIANSGRSALDLLESETFDLLISDLAMPELNGQELHKALTTRFPHLLPRLVFVTGDSLGPSTRLFLAQSGRPVIEKPFTPDDVRRALNEVAGTASPVAASPDPQPSLPQPSLPQPSLPQPVSPASRRRRRRNKEPEP